MTIPDWAELALQGAKPRPPAFQPEKGPDAGALKKWTSIDARIRANWSRLDADRWAIPKWAEGYDQINGGPLRDPVASIKQWILECAIECAWDLVENKSPSRVIDALRELDAINESIGDTAEKLAGLLRQRRTVTEEYVISEAICNGQGLDPVDLLDALELALKTPALLPWASVADTQLMQFLAIARSQSRPGPEWEDLLDQLSARDYRRAYPLDAPDIAVVASGTNKSEFSPWVLRLIATLDTWPWRPGFSLLGYLTNEQLASLAEIVFAAPESAINVEQVRGLKRRYVKRKQQVDDS